MGWLKGKKDRRKKKVQQQTEEFNRSLQGEQLSPDFEKNIARLRQLFTDSDTMKFRRLEGAGGQEFFLVFCDGLVNSEILNQHVIRPLMAMQGEPCGQESLRILEEKVLQANDIKQVTEIKKLVEAVTYGETLLLVNGSSEALLIDTKHFDKRGIEEPGGEQIMSGPREGFCETMLTNLSMVRRRVRSHELKMKYHSIGERTATSICLCYIDSLVNRDVLTELEKRLSEIEIDAVLDSNYIVELIQDHRISPFRTTGYTERPDVVVGKLLEGRVAVFVDGTPVVLTVPYLFIENFQSNEDYYTNYYYASFARALRMVGFLMAVIVPALYIAVVAFHHEMVPTSLFINIARERQNVPLPAALEAFLLLITFDILKETGVRMSSSVGHTLSIVGALVVGQAAVEARLVAAPMIIVVAATGITSLLVPKMSSAVIIARYLLLLAATMMGYLGVVLGMMALAIHILNLSSFGIPQVLSNRRVRFQSFKDTYIRAPWWKMILRPRFIATDRVRMKQEDGK